MSEPPEAPGDAAPEPDPGPDDSALLADLGELLNRLDPPPPDLVEQSKQLWTWRTVDAELASLGSDSLIDEPEPALRSAEQPPRLVTFETPAMVIEVEVADGAGARRLVGQLDPPGPATLELRSADGGSVAGATDELGRFVIGLPAARQRVSLRCVLPDGSAVETAWLPL